MSLRNRSALLFFSIALGVVVGLVGMQVTESEAWFLAIPCCMAAAWLFVADPGACRPGFNRPPTGSDQDGAS